MSRILFVVTADLSKRRTDPAASPRPDYLEITRRLAAAVLDRSQINRSPVARGIARCFGTDAALAWLAFRRSSRSAAILTDGEGIAIPLALLLKLTGRRIPLVTVGHRITAPKKRPFFRRLRVHTHITRIVLHARRQFELAVADLQIPAAKLALAPYQVDVDFWSPTGVPPERLITSVGLEYRDYATLFAAVDGLDAEIAVGSASFWSRRPNRASHLRPPANVRIGSFDQRELRDLYARSAAVVVPLDDVDFQAGVTTILEAMAMAKPVIVSRSQGQTDMVEDRHAVTQPTSLLRTLADEAGVPVEPTGLYVPVGDPNSLRRAITYLLDNPDEAARLGAAGRRLAEQLLTLDHFVDRLARICAEAGFPVPAGSSPLPSANTPIRTQLA